MKKRRFKTEAEFKRDGDWNRDRPNGWCYEMNYLLGQPIDESGLTINGESIIYRTEYVNGNIISFGMYLRQIVDMVDDVPSSDFQIHKVKEFKM